MKALAIKNLNFSYNNETQTIDDFSLDIERGSYVSILGHNGSGKSTIAKLLVGLLTPSSGEITISDVQLNKENLAAIRKEIAIVFQNPDNQFIGATVEDDIAFSLENKMVPREEMQRLVPEYAKKVGVEKYLKKEPGFLSGGQKQRVAIAGALISNPNVLILDEATSMLDPKGKKEIFDLIAKMRKDNKDLTVISITHDVEEACLSDRIILLNKGKIVSDSSPFELFSNEELINNYSLKLPFVFELNKKLKERGIDCEINLKSMEDALCR